jgi:hypothetical protein
MPSRTAAAIDQRRMLAPVKATVDDGGLVVAVVDAAVVVVGAVTVNVPLTVAVPAAVGPVALMLLVPTCTGTATGSFSRPWVVLTICRLTVTPFPALAVFAPPLAPLTVMETGPVK